MNSVTSRILSVAVLASMLSLGCETYNAPPEPVLVQPEGGVFGPGDSLFVRFSEEIDADSLAISLWGDVRDIELEIPDDADPFVDACRNGETCDGVTITVLENRRRARIDFDPDGLGAAGPPLILDINPGLADKDGNDTGRNVYFDFQFQDKSRINTVDLEFQDGVYIMVGSVNEPLPAVLTLISDMKTLKDGTFVMSGAEGDPVSPEFADNTAVPEQLLVDDGNLAWTAHVAGFVKVEDDGTRRVETDPTLIQLPLGPLTLKLVDLRLFGVVVKNEEGNDRIEGTLSFSKIILDSNGRETEYAAGAAAVAGEWVAPNRRPQGHPVICEDECGIVDDRGLGFCEPPAVWPPEGFCEAYEEFGNAQ